MTQEEKAKAYDEAVNKLKGFMAQGVDPLITRANVQDFFTELAESEDERIRKELIEHIKDQQSSFISAPDCRDKYEEEENNKYNSWLAWLEKQGEQKHTEWSEEDEAIYYGVIETEHYMLDVVNGVKVFDVGNESIKAGCQRELDWLKSLKERVQPKQEWSEKDERIIEDASKYLREYANQVQGAYSKMYVECIADRIESLRPQNTWKPSDEQINALDNARHSNPFDVHILDTLFHDLKKLT